MLEDLCRTVRRAAPLLVGDVSGRRSSLLSLRQMDVICPSETELRDAVHEYDDGMPAVVSRVLRTTDSNAAIITLSAEGLITFEPDQTGRSARMHSEHVPSFVAQPIDELGCGDALLATTTLALTAGSSLAFAAVLGNIAAAAQAGRLGNAVIGPADIRRGVTALESAQLVCKAPTPAVMAAG
jgi:sugar/nucleoside kinase (ribokinase family)